LWFDVLTPKQVLFFGPLIRTLRDRGHEVLVTSRGGEAYEELRRLREQHALGAEIFGEWGGASPRGKLEAALRRQRALYERLADAPPARLVCLCSPDASRVAFGLGVPVTAFCDLPTRGVGGPLLHSVRLSLPLAERALHPACVPAAAFAPALGSARLCAYDFLDPVLWLKDQEADRRFFDALALDPERPTVCVREEEHGAAYVSRSYAEFDRAVARLDANLVVLPRYGAPALARLRPDAVVLAEPRALSQVLPFVDVMVGGGGTINVEAAWWGTPVVSTRSFLSHYDAWLRDRGLLVHADRHEEVLPLCTKQLGRRTDASPLRAQAEHASTDALFALAGLAP
jgi:hypothetical protein